jgi:hypothetical protein
MLLLRGEFKKEDMDDKKYPPLFKFDIVRNICLRFAVEIKRNLQITSVGVVSHRYVESRESILLGMRSGQGNISSSSLLP